MDIETKSATSNKEDALNPHKNIITCIGVLNPKTGERRVFRDLKEFNEEIVTADFADFVGHNFKWDLKTLWFHGIKIPVERYVHDSRIAAFVSTEKVTPQYLEWYEQRRKELNKLLPKGSSHREGSLHSLKVLAPYFLEVDPFWEDPTNHDNDDYVLKDVAYTAALHEHFTQQLAKDGQYDFYLRLMEWTRMILRAELEGVKIDLEALNHMETLLQLDAEGVLRGLQEQWSEELSCHRINVITDINLRYDDMITAQIVKKPENAEKIRERYDKLREKAVSKADTEFNFSSPVQLTWLLRDCLNYDITSLEGGESTDKEVLNRLANEGKEDVKLLLKYRDIQKTLTGFIPTYKELTTAEGRIHSSFNMDGTRTGRLSASGPNWQQTPPELKHLVIPDPGTVFVTYDLSAIEPLVLAYYSEDPELVKLIVEGRSFHSANAKAMFSLECDESQVGELHPKLRKLAKTVGLAILYGAGWRRVEIASKQAGIELSESQCKEVVYRIRDTYKGVWTFKQELDSELETGAVIFNLLGRPIKIHSTNEVYMKGLNTLVQSSASDLCLKISENISKIGDGVQPLIWVHDSIVTRVPSQKAEHYSKIIKATFEAFKFETKYGILEVKCDGGVSEEHWE